METLSVFPLRTAENPSRAQSLKTRYPLSLNLHRHHLNRENRGKSKGENKTWFHERHFRNSYGQGKKRNTVFSY
jgi:hypothetical protein